MEKMIENKVINQLSKLLTKIDEEEANLDESKF